MSKYIPILTPAALFLVSLTFYSLHWLTAPPGINGDASRLGLYALDFIHEKLFPFYIYHQFGPHPLIVYLQGLVFSVFGFTITALRGITIVGGAMATPAIYLAGCWLFARQGKVFAGRAAVIAALGLALSTFFASFSRHGIEGALLPGVELLAVAFLWRGFGRGSRKDFALAGAAVGLSQYIYIVARFFPLALAVATLGAIAANRRLLTRWKGLVIAASVAAAVALPQWILFVTHPYTFLARTQQTSGRTVFELPEPSAIIARKLMGQMQMIAWHWDNAYNPYSLKSLLTPILVVALVTGTVYTIGKRKDIFVFVLLMMLTMFMPDLLTFEGFNPSPTRLVPTLPFIFLMAGLGGAILWEWAETIRRLPNWAGFLVPLLVLSFGLSRQLDYATRVKSQVLASQGLEWKNSLVEIAVAEYIGNHLDSSILIPSSEYQRAPLAFLLAEHYPRRLGWQNSPVEEGETVKVIQTLDPQRPTTEWIPSQFRQSEWVLLRDDSARFLPPLPGATEPIPGKSETIVASNGVEVAAVSSARWNAVLPSFLPMQASFANGLDLIGADSGELSPGSPLDLTLYWQPIRRVQRDVEIFAQLYNPVRDVLVANVHRWPLNGVFRVRSWRPGMQLPLGLRLPVAENLDPGPYQLRVGIVDLMGRNRIPLTTGDDFFVVETFKVPLPDDHRKPQTVTQANFGNVFALDGYTLEPVSDQLKLVLFWRATTSPPFDFTTFVHVVDSDDRLVAQLDVQPLRGHYPTSIWSPDEQVTDELTITAIPQGRYRLYVGMYRHLENSWERLQIVTDEEGPDADRLLLQSITVE